MSTAGDDPERGESPPDPVRPVVPMRIGRLLAVMGLLLAAVFGGIGWLQAQSLALLNANAVYQGDNIVWSFFQLETEYLRLQQQLRDAVRSGQAGRFDALRERYDIFVSRISLVEPDRTRPVMPHFDEHPRVMAALHQLVAEMDRVLGPEAPEQAEPATLAALLLRFEAVAPAVRDLSLLANQAVAESITQRNEAVRQQNRIAIGLTVFQCLLILVFAVVVVRQMRALEQRRRVLEQLARSLEEARTEAEQASRAKSAFLANMSHELRTPFNGLLGMMSLLDRSVLTAQQREYLGVARQSGEHLLTILNDVLDFSKLESGRLELLPQPVDLRRVVRDVEALMQGQARAKGLRLEVDVAAELQPLVQADAKRIKQILFNLLGNAIKFTDAGSVHLQVDQIDTPPLTRLRVRDTGIGMDERTLAQLFQRFSQGDSSIGRRFGGTGLGLEISRALARRMDGEITVTSRVGQGSEFTVVLALPVLDPIEPGAPEAAAGLPPPPLPAPEVVLGEPVRAANRLRVLVTDDHPVNRQFMQALLSCLGHEVLLASNGEEAVTIVRTQPCDLVLMDVHMPVMDGLAAARAIRELPVPVSRVPIVALTADAFAESRERVRLAGMDDFLAKPVQLHDVEEVLRRHFGARAVGAANSSGPPVASLSTPPAPPTPAPAIAPRAPRVRRGDAARMLDLTLIADTCAALSADNYRALLAGFLQDESRTFADLLALLDQGHFDASCTAAAHRLKGAAATLGLQELARTAKALEQLDKSTLTTEAAQLWRTQLREQWALSRTLLARLGWTTDEGGAPGERSAR